MIFSEGHSSWLPWLTRQLQESHDDDTAITRLPNPCIGLSFRARHIVVKIKRVKQAVPLRSVGGVLISQSWLTVFCTDVPLRNYSLTHPVLVIKPGGGQTTTSVTHGQCDVRPTVTFSAAEYHRPLAANQIALLSDKDT